MQNALDLKNILSQIDEEHIPELRKILDDFYPQDIAAEYTKLDDHEHKLLFDILSYKQGAKVLIELDDYAIEKVFDFLSDDQIVKFTNELELDDAADLIGLLHDDRSVSILEKIQRPYEIKELLSYEPDTCGGIMNPEFISVRSDMKVAAALRFVRLKAKNSNIAAFYIYVTKKFGELIGVVSLKDLFLASDDKEVTDYMEDEVIAVKVHEDQEVAADLFSKYRLLAIPVTNENDQLVGIITYDDVVEVLEEETTEDIYQSSGINIEDDDSSSETVINEYYAAYKARTPWLIVTLIGQYLAATLIAKFDSTIALIPIAISFMPLLSGLSGNIGNQSSTIIIRGISIGEIDTDKSVKIFVHEIIVSLVIGLTCAILTALMSYFAYNNLLLSALIGGSLIVSMMLAVGLGTVTPLMFKKLDLDPAAASGPLITTIIDITTFFIYLSLITNFVSKLS